MPPLVLQVSLERWFVNSSRTGSQQNSRDLIVKIDRQALLIALNSTMLDERQHIFQEPTISRNVETCPKMCDPRGQHFARIVIDLSFQSLKNAVFT